MAAGLPEHVIKQNKEVPLGDKTLLGGSNTSESGGKEVPILFMSWSCGHRLLDKIWSGLRMHPCPV